LQSHPKFKSVAEVSPLLYSRELQMGEEKKAERMALGKAVADGIIANETLAYFIGRTYLFAQRVRLAGAMLKVLVSSALWHVQECNHTVDCVQRFCYVVVGRPSLGRQPARDTST
jgi:glycyl-tRNA synthetase (class II)